MVSRRPMCLGSSLDEAARPYVDSLKPSVVLRSHRFEPKRFLEDRNLVVVLADLEATVKETGTRLSEEDEPHIWYFDERGQVIRFRHRADTHQHWAAYKGQDIASV